MVLRRGNKPTVVVDPEVGPFGSEENLRVRQIDDVGFALLK